MPSDLEQEIQDHWDFPGSSAVKNLPANAGNAGSVPEWARSPGGRNGNPFHYSCLGKSHGYWSLAGCSPWGCRESDTTERARMHTRRDYSTGKGQWSAHWAFSYTTHTTYTPEFKPNQSPDVSPQTTQRRASWLWTRQRNKEHKELNGTPANLKTSVLQRIQPTVKS